MNTRLKRIFVNTRLGLFLVRLVETIFLTPVVVVVVMLVTGIFADLDDLIRQIQSNGWWWIFPAALPITFIWTFIDPWLFNKDKHEFKKQVDGLMFYYTKRMDRVSPDIASNEPSTDSARKNISERAAVFFHDSPELWQKYYPHKEYPIDIFFLVDDYIAESVINNRKLYKARQNSGTKV